MCLKSTEVIVGHSEVILCELVEFSMVPWRKHVYMPGIVSLSDRDCKWQVSYMSECCSPHAGFPNARLSHIDPLPERVSFLGEVIPFLSS